MTYILSGAFVFLDKKFRKVDILVSDGKAFYSSDFAFDKGTPVYNFQNCYVFPGFADVHVHLREPGFSYKETIQTGTKAAARGGYCAVCSMPNLNPVPDSLPHLQKQLDIIEQDACISVYPFGSITKNEDGEALSDMQSMAPHVSGFSDDGRGVEDAELMKKAMLCCKRLDRPIAAHCEDKRFVRDGYIHNGEYARQNGHRAILSESEFLPIERDVQLVKETGCKYHVCHISCAESVDIIRKAKASGVDITCETAPHYLLLDDSMLQEDGAFKMNPPIRSQRDRIALLEGIADGTIDMIATDHAPHAFHEKNKGLRDSLMGIVGLETAFPLLYTYLVKPGLISIEKLIALMHSNPCQRFALGNLFEIGKTANFTVFDLNSKYRISPDDFLSMGKSTPFAGYEVYGKCRMTVSGGKIAWLDEQIQYSK